MDDFERSLNKRGLRDAPLMAELLKEKIKSADILISSPANRALSTALFFADVFGFKKKEIVQDENLYLPDYNSIVEIIRQVDISINKILLFTHNPAITDAANFLSGRYIDNIPTCGIVGLKLLTNSWKEIDKKKCELEFFEFPKKYL